MADESGKADTREESGLGCYLLRFKPYEGEHIHLLVDQLVRYEIHDVVSLVVDGKLTKYRVGSVDDIWTFENLAVSPGVYPTHQVHQFVREVYLVPFGKREDEQIPDAAFPM
jgi:hypothetical protein